MEVQFLVVYVQLCDVVVKFEVYYWDMQDIEFVVDDGKFYVLQVCFVCCSVKVSFCFVVEMVVEWLIICEEVILCIDFVLFE